MNRYLWRTINDLTNDEDQRQDLWVCYLSGDSTAILQNRLTTIQRENELYSRVRESLWYLHKSPPSPSLLSFVGKFSEFEQSIIMLLFLGLSVNEVSEYKDISIVRIRQIVFAIKNNPVWEKEWLLKETLQTKKNTV